MSLPVVAGATIICTCGLAPGTLLVTSQATVLLGGAPAATITDTAPFANITPCGMCTSLANPTVASATAAALGVLTPMPCTPAPAGTWTGGGGPTISQLPALQNDATLVCSYGGSISIVNPAQSTVIF